MKKKEEILISFSKGDLKKLVTKPQIAGHGLNWQHCGHMTMFPSHSFEQIYQAQRRCWRYGRKEKVKVDMITTPGELGVLQNLNIKQKKADEMFLNLVQQMKNEMNIKPDYGEFHIKTKKPDWL